MLEYPEVRVIAAQLKKSVCGAVVEKVLPPTKKHKFSWFNGDPVNYNNMIQGAKITDSTAFGIFAEIEFENGCKLCFDDGANIRLIDKDELPKDYQLAVILKDNRALVFSVSMYGGIFLHKDDFNAVYYHQSKQSFDLEGERLKNLFNEHLKDKSGISVKAFLATEQRFPGLGNGVLQDILFCSGINPRRKISSLTEKEKEDLLYCIENVLKDMTDRGGRDTEKDLHGNAGGYRTIMSKLRMEEGCPECGGKITKEAYMGGSVYYCPNCQPMTAKTEED
jgi:formamidopyrimidine-DNA glycosylase